MTDDRSRELKRRDFLRAALVAAAGGAVPRRLLGQAAPVGEASRPLPQEVAFALANGEPPALQFQAYPGGTGALMERLWREHGDAMFRRTPIDVAPWSGPVPTDEADLAFLPVHRLSALLREGRVTSVDLTEIYLARLRRYDPTLLFAVTILEGRAREEAQQADAELRAGTWRGPLHGIP
jgi:hypothetical protein